MAAHAQAHTALSRRDLLASIMSRTSELVPQKVAIPRATLLQAALLGGEVHVHQAESARVPFRPLEVVHECPREIAFDRHAAGTRLMHGQKMALKIVAPLRVCDRAIRAQADPHSSRHFP